MNGSVFFPTKQGGLRAGSKQPTLVEWRSRIAATNDGTNGVGGAVMADVEDVGTSASQLDLSIRLEHLGRPSGTVFYGIRFQNFSVCAGNMSLPPADRNVDASPLLGYRVPF